MVEVVLLLVVAIVMGAVLRYLSKNANEEYPTISPIQLA